MKGPRPTGVEDELERRLTVLAHVKETHRRLPLADAMALTAITIGSFVAVLIAQVL